MSKTCLRGSRWRSLMGKPHQCPQNVILNKIPMVKMWIKSYIILWSVLFFTFVHLGLISCWV
jgi:hypothetical protein